LTSDLSAVEVDLSDSLSNEVERAEKAEAEIITMVGYENMNPYTQELWDDFTEQVTDKSKFIDDLNQGLAQVQGFIDITDLVLDDGNTSYPVEVEFEDGWVETFDSYEELDNQLSSFYENRDRFDSEFYYWSNIDGEVNLVNFEGWLNLRTGRNIDESTRKLGSHISEVSKELDEKLNAEVASRKSGDSKLSTELMELATELDERLNDEEAARIVGDEALQDDLEKAIDELEAARIAGDEALQADLDAAIAEEHQHHIDGDEALQAQIDTILDGSTVDLDQFKEVVDFVNSIDVENDLVLLNKVTEINDRIDAEVTTLQNADSVIANDLNSHIISTSNEFSIVNTAIETEVADRDAAVNNLSDSFDSYKDTTDTQILNLTTSIASEVERAESVEDDLQSQIDEEVSRAMEAEAGLEQKVSKIISNTDLSSVDSFVELIDAVNEVTGKNFDSIYAKKVGVTPVGDGADVALSTPVKPESMMLYINGLMVENGEDYTEILVDGMVTGATLIGDALDLAVAGAKLASYGVHGSFTDINFNGSGS
jgi:hypothetical protein